MLNSISSRPNAGRGLRQSLAKHLGIHSSTLSQILAGKKHLTLEQACLAAEFFYLNENETQYFLALVSRERAGTALLRKKYDYQIKSLRINANKLKNVITQDRELSEADKAIFYSNWYYTAIWAITSIDGYNTKDAIQKYFGLSQTLVSTVVEFLLQSGLLEETKDGLKPLNTYIHLEANSPLVARHHANWRLMAMQRHPMLKDEELSYTSPMTLSVDEAAKVRTSLFNLIKEINKSRANSDAEALYCLNLDWFQVPRSF